MSAIAIVLAEMGHTVSGSDIREQPDPRPAARRRRDRARRPSPRRSSHGCDAVTYSTAIPETNIELDEARRSRHARRCAAPGCSRRSARRRSRSAVAGTHGKTTTTSMLMLILAEAGLRPSFVIGGDVTDMGTGAQWTGGEWLVVEADESDGTHLELPLHGTILTNVEVDHLDHYGTLDAIVDGFDRYLAQIAGPKVLCVDDPVCRAARRAARRGHLRHSPRAPTSAPSTCAPRRGSLRVRRRARTARCSGTVELPLRGAAQRAQRHRRDRDGARDRRRRSTTAPRRSARFGGVARRFDIRGIDDGATLVDDYAHLPAEIAAVLAAARTQRRRLAAGGRRVPAEPVQPDGDDVARVPRRVRRRRCRRAHRHLRQRHDADPRRHRQAGRQRGARRASRRAGGVAAAARRPGRLSSPGNCATATCASRWAAATSRRCPTRCSRGARSCAAVGRRRAA